MAASGPRGWSRSATPMSTRSSRARWGNSQIGVPAKAGTHLSASEAAEEWIPAFAGTRSFAGVKEAPLKENADVLGRQHVLVEGQLASGDLQPAIDSAQQILPAADIEILLALGPAAIDDEVGIRHQFRRRLALGHLDIADHMAGARRRGPGPGPARLQASHPSRAGC